MSKFTVTALLALAAGSTNAASSLADIKHVIMIMMENRSLQHVSANYSLPRKAMARDICSF